jgi:hypothetical protein
MIIILARDRYARRNVNYNHALCRQLQFAVSAAKLFFGLQRSLARRHPIAAAAPSPLPYIDRPPPNNRRLKLRIDCAS